MTETIETPPNEVTIKNVRLAFSSLFEESSYQGSKPQFGATFLVPKGSQADKDIQAAIASVAKDKWPQEHKKILAAAKESSNTNCYPDGDSAKKSHLDGHAGHMALSAKNVKRPTIVDRNGAPLVQADGKPYDGCFVLAKVSFWAQDNNHGKAVRASLLGVQFMYDGDSFSAGRVASAEEFEDLTVDDEDDSLV